MNCIECFTPLKQVFQLAIGKLPPPPPLRYCDNTRCYRYGLAAVIATESEKPKEEKKK